MSYANGLNMCGVWASGPEPSNTIARMRTWNEPVAGAQFFTSDDQQAVADWSQAAADECARFRAVVASYRQRRFAELGDADAGADGRLAYLHSLIALL